MAEQILQSSGLNGRRGRILPCVEQVSRNRMAAKMMQLAGGLTGYVHGRRRREAMESFMPRKSHEDERRLEFERFLYW